MEDAGGGGGGGDDDFPNNSTPLPFQVLSFPQELSVLCLGWITASFSIAGSCCILYLIHQREQKRTTGGARGMFLHSDNTLGRLLLGMSAYDVLHSMGLMAQGLLLPRDTSPRYFAMGNDQTCTFMGFWLQAGFTVAFYNGMISFYYLCVIRHGMTARQIRTKYEIYMHTIAIGFPLVTALIGVGMGIYHESYAGPLCWIADYPEGCDGDVDVPCVSFLLGYLFAGIPVGVIFLCIVTNMIRIYRHVHTTLSQGARRSFDSVNQTQRIEQVATQAYLYVAVFCLTFAFAFLTQSLEGRGPDLTWDETSIFPYIVLNQLFFPLQGFFNFIIYLRPRYITVRSYNLQKSRWWAFQEALRREATAPPESSSVPASTPRRAGRRQCPLPPLRGQDDATHTLPLNHHHSPRVSPVPSAIHPHTSSSEGNCHYPYSSSSNSSKANSGSSQVAYSVGASPSPLESISTDTMVAPNDKGTIEETYTTTEEKDESIGL